MLNLTGSESSYWQESAEAPSYSRLTEDLDVDVAIAGGGIAGLTAAYLLKKSGQNVAVLEKNTIGSGTTGKTTGKITSQHNLIYKELSDRLGLKTAKTYAEANQTAVEEIIKLIRVENINCDMVIDDNFVFTSDSSKTKQFRAEAKVAAFLGLPAVFVTNSPLPFKIKAAVKFSNQAHMNAQKYVNALARLVDGQGSHVFEHSEVSSFSDYERPNVSTDTAKVTAKEVIVATKVPAAPLMARGGYALLEYPHTSYIVAGITESRLKGMYISPDKDHYSILPIKTDRQQLILIGGENHIPGLGNSTKRHQKLADYAEKHFGVSSIDYRWKGMDYMAYDEIPLIGKLYPWSKHVFVATGFKKWGLSTSMVAAMILRNTILGENNPWAAIFNSMRLGPIISIPRNIMRSL